MAKLIRNFSKLFNCFQFNTFRQTFGLSPVPLPKTDENGTFVKNVVRNYSAGAPPHNTINETLLQAKKKSMPELMSDSNTRALPFDWRNQNKKKGKESNRMIQRGANNMQSMSTNNNYSMNQEYSDGSKDNDSSRESGAFHRKGIKINRYKQSKSLPKDFLPLIHARNASEGFHSKQTKLGTTHQFKQSYDARALSSVILADTLLDLSKHKINILPNVTSSALTTIPSSMSCLPTLPKKSVSVSETDHEIKSYQNSSRTNENNKTSIGLMSDLDDDGYEYERGNED